MANSAPPPAEGRAVAVASGDDQAIMPSPVAVTQATPIRIAYTHLVYAWHEN